MHRLSVISGLIATSFFVGGCATLNLELARDGRAQYAIVTNTNAVPAEQTAAQELSDYLAKVTGARFAVMSETNAVLPSRAIYVGWTDFARKQGIDASKLGEEEWIIKSCGRNLVLAGGRPRGTLYAVYEFLEQQIGCRWFDAFTESIPSQPFLALKKMDLRGRPAFRYREIYTGDDSCNTNHWPMVAFRARNKETVGWYSKYGLGYPYGSPGGCHTFYAYSKDFPTNHPEYFSMDASGKRVRAKSGSGPGQLCLTNPDMRKLMLEQLKKFIAQDRKERMPAPWVYDISHNDGGESYICSCPTCKAFTEKEGSDSGLMVDFINELADGIKAEYPDVFIMTFAYGCTVKPPKTMKPRDNVIIRLAQLNAEWAPKEKLGDYPDLFKPMTNAVNRSCCETLLNWSKITRHMAIWDYWILYRMNPMGYPTKDRYQTPYVNLACIASDLELFLNNNVKVMSTECEDPETQSFFALKRWLGLKLMQDPRQPAEPLIEAFMSGYYGPASSRMSEYLAYMTKRIGAVPETEKLSATQEEDRSYLDLDFYVTSIRLLDEAEAMCGTNKPALLHVQRERIPVDSGLLGMWDHLLKKLPAGQAMPFDRDAVLKRYEATRLTQMEAFRSTDKMENGKKGLEKELMKLMEKPLIEKRKAEKAPALRVPALAAEAAGGDPAKVDWTKAAALGSWGTLDGMPRPARQINGAVAHDGKYFYVSLEEALDPTNLTRNADIWSGDDWELFFAAQRGKAPYRQLGISPDGKQVGYAYAGIQDKSSAWTNAIVKSDTTGKQWRVRMSIPLADLIPNGAKGGQPFYMNVYRGTPGPGESMCWSPIFGKYFHDLNRLAELTLEPLPPDAAAGWPWLKYGIAPTTNPACIPTRRTDWALNYHKGMLALENKDKVAVLFLGDSIMNDIWRSRSLDYAERVKAGGNPVWQKYYEPLRAANFGISADETGNLLWRITEGGGLEGFKPKVVVLLIGINNLIRGQAPERTADGITAIVGYLKNKLPDTKILLLGVFPCWQPADNPVRAKVKQTNALISPLHDGQRVFYLDVGHVFVEPDGNISKEKLQDTLHPSEKGYALWAEAMQPYLADLLNNGGKGGIWQK